MGKKISLQRQSVIESAMWNRAGSLGEEVSASAASIAHGRVTSVGTKRALAGLIPAPPAQAPRPPPSPGHPRLRAGPNPALSGTTWCLTIRYRCKDVTATTFSANTVSLHYGRKKEKMSIQDHTTWKEAAVRNF